MAIEPKSTTVQSHDSRIAFETPLSPHEITMVNTSEVPLIPPEPDLSLHLHSIRLLDPESITSDFDKLRFEAAAQDQLVLHPTPLYQLDVRTDRPSPEQHLIQPTPSSIFLISSPYNTPSHHLALSSPHLTTPSRLFALALTALKPLVPTYATTPYSCALDFPTVLALLRNLTLQAQHEWQETAFYVVVFRSQLKQDIDQEWLYRLDEESHREACESGGLLKYWFGKGDGERRNLATCFWQGKEDAIRGGLGPWHRRARAAGRELYESIVFSTYRFTIKDGAEEYGVGEWVQ